MNLPDRRHRAEINFIRLDRASLYLRRKLALESLNLVNSLSPEQRRIAYHTVSEEGQTYRQNGGGLGCGGYVNVVGGNSVNATLSFSKLATSWSANGISLEADLGFSLDAQIEGHLDPCKKAPAIVGRCRVSSSI